MKRKYPVSFFVFGVFGNLLKYIIIGLIGLILLIIGLFGIPVCKIAGAVVLGGYLLFCIIRQLLIRSTSLKESDNPDFNEFMNGAFGDNHIENGLSSHERVVKMVEDRIKSQDPDID